MICIKCGFMKRGKKEFFVCDDCSEFSEFIKTIFEDVHERMERASSIDPETHTIFRLLADSTFITSKNPQTAIFYKMSDYIVSRAFAGATEVSEEELNRNVVTTRGWGDAFKVFEDLNLVRVRLEKYRRVLFLTDKTKKFAIQYLGADKLSDIGLRTRLAHIYAGYVLLYILKKVADLAEETENKSELPYNQIPRTLWVTLMFLWTNAYNNTETFGEESFTEFVSRRRISSAIRGKIINALQAMDGRSTQGLIKDISIKDGERKFTFEDYVINEMQRIRELVRERER
jgi:hypothetical protein